MTEQRLQAMPAMPNNLWVDESRGLRLSLRAQLSNPRFRRRPLADLTASCPLAARVRETGTTRPLLGLRPRTISSIDGLLTWGFSRQGLNSVFPVVGF